LRSRKTTRRQPTAKDWANAPTDSTTATRVLLRSFPSRAGDTGAAVIASAGRVTPQMTSFVSEVRHTPGIAGVDPPIRSRDGTVELLPITFTNTGHATRAAAAHVKAIAAAERKDGLQVELSGMMFQSNALGNHEIAGIVIAVIVLLVAFGSCSHGAGRVMSRSEARRRIRVDALREATERNGRPKIFNTDQGMQFTSATFLDELSGQGVRISMDGKGRFLDNIFIERL